MSRPEPSFAMRTVLSTIRSRFSSVRQLSTNDLQALFEKDHSHVTLLDIREQDEFTVSHLPEARHIPPSFSNYSQLLGEILEAPNATTPIIVCYCSLGYRSSQMAAKLQSALASMCSDRQGTVEGGCGAARSVHLGDVLIYNLEGSMFKWANEGRCLVRPGGNTTESVHPYSSVWGRLLEGCRHQWRPDHP